MNFISYAQNFEDIMLWRALKHVEKGFYIDIGAQDPVVDSVSMGFYEQGWRGVNVEPTKQYSQKLRTARPDEVIIQSAIGKNKGEIEFYEIPDTGLSTADSEIAQRHEVNGFSVIKYSVSVITLDELFDSVSDRTVHWLKIDVEGFEKNVIESWAESEIRPWIIVIESTLPLTQEESHHSWEELVTSKGYTFAYFDGLNRFYVSDAYAELTDLFKLPPNVYDRIVFSGESTNAFCTIPQHETQQVESRAEQAESSAKQLKVLSQNLESKLIQADVLGHELELKTKQLEARSTQAEAWGCELIAKIKSLDSRINESYSRINELNQQILSIESERNNDKKIVHHLSLRAMNAEQGLEALLTSRSFHITKPLRWFGTLLRRIRNRFRKRSQIGR